MLSLYDAAKKHQTSQEMIYTETTGGWTYGLRFISFSLNKDTNCIAV